MNLTSLNLSVVTLGCNKNQTDSEYLIAGLSENFTITPNLEEADIIVLSPCSFLEVARSEALEYINDLAIYKRDFRCKCLIVTGCYAQHLRDQILKDNSEVDLVIGLSDIETFVESIKNFFVSNKRSFLYGNNNVFGVFSDDVKRIVSHPFYAYVKISEGCENHCSYCLIPMIRGDYRSRDKQIIISEIKDLIDSGIKEINIVSQDIGMYGEDIYEKNSFVELIREIAELDGDFWIRLLYMHPKHINTKLADLIEFNKKVLNYLDIPLQHVNNDILESMNRCVSKEDLIERLDLLRERIPDIVLRTTFIVGYPGEDESKFEELKEFVFKEQFDRVGVFAYSREQGTKAFDYNDQLDEQIKQKRVQEIMCLQQDISIDKNKKLIGKNLEVLYESYVELEDKSVLMKGRIYSMAPEVDGNVYVSLPEDFDYDNFKGILRAKITDCDEYDLVGKICHAQYVENPEKKNWIPKSKI